MARPLRIESFFDAVNNLSGKAMSATVCCVDLRISEIACIFRISRTSGCIHLHTIEIVNSSGELILVDASVTTAVQNSKIC